MSMSVVSEISASSAVKKQEKKIVENLTKRTHFSSSEIERLLALYRKTMVSSLKVTIYNHNEIKTKSFRLSFLYKSQLY